MNHRVVYFYLYSLMLLFVEIKYVAAMKIIQVVVKKISPFCNLCDSSELSGTHFLSKFQESGDESSDRVLLSSFINVIVC